MRGKGRPKGTPRNRYIIYNNKNKDNDLPLIVDGTANECAAMMGISMATFYCYVTRPVRKWTIIPSEDI